MALDTFGVLYAVVVAAGGAFGYVKSGSVPSLAAGVLFGSAIGVGAYQFSRNPDNYEIALGTSSVLAGLMGSRYYSSRKFMPAGFICVIRLTYLLKAAKDTVLVTCPVGISARVETEMQYKTPASACLGMAVRYALRGLEVNKTRA